MTLIVGLVSQRLRGTTRTAEMFPRHLSSPWEYHMILRASKDQSVFPDAALAIGLSQVLSYLVDMKYNNWSYFIV
jgi:hypothetical protein